MKYQFYINRTTRFATGWRKEFRERSWSSVYRSTADPSRWPMPVSQHLLLLLKASERKAFTLRSRDSWPILKSVNFWKIKAGGRRQTIWAVLTLSKEISGLVMTAERALLLRSVYLNNFLKHADVHEGVMSSRMVRRAVDSAGITLLVSLIYLSKTCDWKLFTVDYCWWIQCGMCMVHACYSSLQCEGHMVDHFVFCSGSCRWLILKRTVLGEPWCGLQIWTISKACMGRNGHCCPLWRILCLVQYH